MSPRRPEDHPDEIHEISRAIGQLQSDVQSIVRTQADDRKFAASYRTDVRKQVGEIAALVSGLAHDVTEIKPEVKLVKDARLAREENEKTRAKRLKTAGALVVFAASLFAFGRQLLDAILAAWHFIWGMKPP